MSLLRAACWILTVLFLAALLGAQGIQVRRGAPVLFGSKERCTQPATVVLKRLQKSTPEWKTMQSEGVRKGSARYDLLTSKMNTRIQSAVRKMAEQEGRDCVICKQDLKDSKGLEVTDLTKVVMGELDS